MTEKTLTFRVRGSHSTEREIRGLLGKDPDIHSGMLPRGCFNIRVTPSEYEYLKNSGIKVTIDKRFHTKTELSDALKLTEDNLS